MDFDRAVVLKSFLVVRILFFNGGRRPFSSMDAFGIGTAARKAGFQQPAQIFGKVSLKQMCAATGLLYPNYVEAGGT